MLLTDCLIGLLVGLYGEQLIFFNNVRRVVCEDDDIAGFITVEFLADVECFLAFFEDDLFAIFLTY